MADLEALLRRIDGRGYKAYRELRGAEWAARGLRFRFLRIQGDPFAPPSVVEARAVLRGAPGWALSAPVALADYVARRLHRSLARLSERMGEGNSGLLSIPRPGPVIVARSSVVARPGGRLIARIRVGLPARRRRVLGGEAAELLLDRLPRALEEALRGLAGDEALLRHVEAWRLQEEIRGELPRLRLVSFIGEGAVLPRRCGGCWEPLPGAVPFEPPPSLRVEVETRCCGPVAGMGIPRGVTVVAGSAFHGKTTLLEAIAAGVWDHVPGDGRERVVTLREAMYVRAEDGRRVSCVDIDSFIHDLPGGRPTRCFSTEDASGATSVAAAIQEAVEAGARLLLLDEDTAATNMLYLDERAKPLTRRHTVTPLSELARSLAERGVSLIVVSTGSLPLLAAADTVIVMEDYRPRDATGEAKRLAEEAGVEPGGAEYRPPRPRRIARASKPAKPRVRAGMLTARDMEAPISLLRDIHLEDPAQLETLAAAAERLPELRGLTLAEAARRLEELVSRDPGALKPSPGLAEVRALDIAYLLNRLPHASMEPAEEQKDIQGG